MTVLRIVIVHQLLPSMIFSRAGGASALRAVPLHGEHAGIFEKLITILRARNRRTPANVAGAMPVPPALQWTAAHPVR